MPAVQSLAETVVDEMVGAAGGAVAFYDCEVLCHQEASVHHALAPNRLVRDAAQVLSCHEGVTNSAVNSSSVAGVRSRCLPERIPFAAKYSFSSALTPACRKSSPPRASGVGHGLAASASRRGAGLGASSPRARRADGTVVPRRLPSARSQDGRGHFLDAALRGGMDRYRGAPSRRKHSSSKLEVLEEVRWMEGKNEPNEATRANKTGTDGERRNNGGNDDLSLIHI